MGKRIFLAFLLLIFGVQFSIGQDFLVSQATVEDGLSQSTVLCLLQDQKGFLWVGTKDGLNKYDGGNFEVYRTNITEENCISDNEILALLEDRKGNIWIGTGNGLTRYDVKRNEFEIFRHILNDSSSLSNSYITTLFEDFDGTILIGTRFGLNRFDPEKQQFIRIDSNRTSPLERKFVKSIFVGSNNYYWIVYEKEICLFKRESNSIISIDEEFKNSVSLKGGTKIHSFLEDDLGNIWIGTDKGLNYFDIEKKEI